MGIFQALPILKDFSFCSLQSAYTEFFPIVKQINELLVKLDAFNKSLEKQWMNECKPFGYEVLDGRLGFLKNRIVSAKNRVNKYLKGEIKQIEELEEDILPFDGRNDELSWNWWLRNVSPSQ